MDVALAEAVVEISELLAAEGAVVLTSLNPAIHRDGVSEGVAALPHALRLDSSDVPLLRNVCRGEIEATTTPHQLMRETSATSLFLSSYVSEVASGHFTRHVSAVLNKVVEGQWCVKEDLPQILNMCDELVAAICDSVCDMPPALLHLLAVLEECCAERFPHDSLSSVVGLYVLRFVGPRIASPDAFGLCPSERPIEQRKVFALMSKLVLMSSTCTRMDSHPRRNLVNSRIRQWSVDIWFALSYATGMGRDQSKLCRTGMNRFLTCYIPHTQSIESYGLDVMVAQKTFVRHLRIHEYHTVSTAWQSYCVVEAFSDATFQKNERMLPLLLSVFAIEGDAERVTVHVHAIASSTRLWDLVAPQQARPAQKRCLVFLAESAMSSARHSEKYSAMLQRGEGPGRRVELSLPPRMTVSTAIAEISKQLASIIQCGDVLSVDVEVARPAERRRIDSVVADWALAESDDDEEDEEESGGSPRRSQSLNDVLMCKGSFMGKWKKRSTREKRSKKRKPKHRADPAPEDRDQSEDGTVARGWSAPAEQWNSITITLGVHYQKPFFVSETPTTGELLTLLLASMSYSSPTGASRIEVGRERMPSMWLADSSAPVTRLLADRPTQPHGSHQFASAKISRTTSEGTRKSPFRTLVDSSLRRIRSSENWPTSGVLPSRPYDPEHHRLVLPGEVLVGHSYELVVVERMDVEPLFLPYITATRAVAESMALSGPLMGDGYYPFDVPVFADVQASYFAKVEEKTSMALRMLLSQRELIEHALKERAKSHQCKLTAELAMHKLESLSLVQKAPESSVDRTKLISPWTHASEADILALLLENE